LATHPIPEETASEAERVDPLVAAGHKDLVLPLHPVGGSVRDLMLRYLGALLVLLGCLLLAVDGTRWDRLILSFGESGHGLHASELVGFGMAVIGVAALWRRPR
jgi:hypothetical protein